MRFPPVIDTDKMFSEGFESLDLPHIALGPTLPTQYYEYAVANGFGHFLRASSYVDYVHTDRVMARTKKSNLVKIS